MSRIDDLIAELCPDGVEFQTLQSIAYVGTGSSNRVDSDDEGIYPFYVRSKNVMRSRKYIFDEEAIIIPGEGGIGDIFHYACGKYDLHQRAYRIHFKDSRINSKFAYYYLMSCFKKFIMMKAMNATVSSIRKPMIENFPIPIPPLSVQQEIVRILDKFTTLEAELEAELKAELKARKKQHDHYLNSLFIFPNRADVKYMSVGELFEFKNGLNKGKEYFGKGTPIVNFTDVFKNRYLTADNLKGRVNVTPKEIGLYSAHKGDMFFTRTSETQEEIGMVSVLVDDVESCVFSGFVLRARPTTALLLPKYCSFCFSSYTLRKEIIKNSTYTTRALTSGTKLSKLFILVPPIEEQERIVAILDRFDALVNDITQGLPAEIAARRQQYEYYRDKLLTFKEKVS